MMLFDWKCPRHGIFEGSHPICPALGCDSEGVAKTFVKAPGTRSDSTKRFDDGMKKSADMYNQTNWLTAREGESAKANNRADEMMWGDAAVQRAVGRPLTAAIGAPEGKAYAGSAALPTSVVSGSNPISRAEQTGVKKQDDKWRAQLVETAKEARTK